MNKTNINDVIRSTFKNASEYYRASSILMLDINLMNVILVNISFAIELYFKTILYNEQKSKENWKFIKEHNLFELYKMLSKKTQKEIKKRVIIKNDMASLEQILEEEGDAFIYIRYMNEKNSMVVNYTFLFELCDRLDKYCKEKVMN